MWAHLHFEEQERKTKEVKKELGRVRSSMMSSFLQRMELTRGQDRVPSSVINGILLLEQSPQQPQILHHQDHPENASSAPDNQTELTSAIDDLTEPPCTPNDMTDTIDIREEEVCMRAKPQAAVDHLHPGLATTEGEMDGWVHMEQPRNKQAHALATQLEKMRLDMELTMTRYRYEDKEKQREHEEKMEELRLQAPATPPSRGGHHLLLPQDQYTLILYCFIFMHIICIARELMFFLIKKHDMIAISILIMCAIKMFWK